MNPYTRLALEVIAQLGGYRADVERSIANGCTVDMFIYLRAGSDRYCELVAWGLDCEGRKQLDNAIVVELRRQAIVGWRDA